jgi:hypothetical protein
MQAPPSVRVMVRKSAALPLAATALWCLAGVCVASWLGPRIGAVGWGVAVIGVTIVATLLTARIVRAHRAAPAAVLAWDGQQWWLQATPQSLAQAGRLSLQFDFDGWSLVRFDTDEPVASRGRRSWWWATPRTVQGPWSAWRAALLHPQHRRLAVRSGPPAQPVS